MVPGPAGMRCPDCASLRANHLYKVNPLHVIIQSVIGVAAGWIGAMIVTMAGFFFFFIFFGAAAYGAGVAELMLKAIGRKHGRIVEVVGAASLVAGGLVPVLFDLILTHSFVMLFAHWAELLAIGIAASACFGRLKYF